MQNLVKRASAGAVMGGALLFTGGMGLASAAPPQLQDGLVNVALGDVTILQNVRVDAAAEILADVCPKVSASDISALATQVDRDGGTQQVAECTAFTKPVDLQQNAPGQGNAANAPGINNTAPGQSTAPGQNMMPGQ